MSSFLDFLKRARWLGLIVFVSFNTLCTGCGKTAPIETAPLIQWFKIGLGDKTVEIQIAYKDTEMEKGLMNRTSMGEHRGMLFYYDPPKQMSFWMRNTKIPLDIGFFTADGILREVYSMYPMDERSVKSRRDDLLIALEMNQGWYAKNDIRVGDTLDLVELKKALQSRGVANRIIPF